jgi:PHD/YefM family antitoxin component YafN of YafNO toxin-antitoxin module
VFQRKGAEMEIIHEQYIIDSEGKKTAVIIPIEQYEKLLEDLHDLAVVAERRAEESISLKEMKRRLKDNGLL